MAAPIYVFILVLLFFSAHGVDTLGQAMQLSIDEVESEKADPHSRIFMVHAEEDALIDSFIQENPIPSVLIQYGLPIGLLPVSVEDFSLSDDGDFEVHLSHPCYVQFDYEVYYSGKITGKISYGSIANLSGIQAKEAFLWFPVTGIRVPADSSEYIFFDVGRISKKLPLAQFQVAPDCKSGKAVY